MSSKVSTELPTVVDVGKLLTFSKQKSCYVRFHDFLSLPSKKNDVTTSPAFECHGYNWSIDIYPGGQDDDYSDEGEISMCVNLIDSLLGSHNGSTTVKAAMSIRIPKIQYRTELQAATYSLGEGAAVPDFISRNKVISCLDENGTLTIEVNIKVYTEDNDENETFASWRPKKTIENDMYKLLTTAHHDDADVIFSVQGQKVYAHKCILRIRAPLLADIASESPPRTPIPIDGINYGIFSFLLQFVYTDKYPDVDTRMDNKDTIIGILLVADKFGCHRLKIYAETNLVTNYLKASTAIDLLLLADAHSCALLKESAMRFVVSNASSLRSSPEWSKIKESTELMDEVMGHIIEQSSTNVDRTAFRSNDGKVHVDGSGVEAINGVYEPSGTLNGVCKYVKEGMWNERPVTFSLYCPRCQGLVKPWYISILTPNGQDESEAEAEIDFYVAPVVDGYPPTDGWITLKDEDGEGLDPPPRVMWNSDGTNDDAYLKLSVREILIKLEEKGLDIDGTRQMLLKRLRGEEESNKASLGEINNNNKKNRRLS